MKSKVIVRKDTDKIRVRHNWKILIVMLVLVILLILVISEIKVRLAEKEGKLECESDSDCVKQQASCCGCNMGGTEVCMSKQNASIVQKNIEKCQKDIVCIAMYNCDSKSCKCVNNKCIS